MPLSIDQVQMMSDKVLVEPDTGEEIRESGLILPGASVQMSNMGVVRGVGPGLTTSKGVLVPTEIRVGDHVCWTKHTGIEIEIDGKPFKVLTPKEITCRLD